MVEFHRKLAKTNILPGDNILITFFPAIMGSENANVCFGPAIVSFCTYRLNESLIQRF